MLLREFFKSNSKIILEGGNLQIGDVEANRIDSNQRPQVVPIIDNALTAINNTFKSINKGIPLWMPSLLKSKKFLAGSSFHFFNRAEISDADFAKVKRTVGDIDTQVDKNMGDQIRNWLSSLAPNTQIGPAQFAGMDDKDPSQILTLWKFPSIVIVDDQGKETPITIQIDLELKPFQKGGPTSWAQFSASSSWDDLSQGIKGVFHKWIIRSLTSLTSETFLLRKFGVRKTTEKPTTDHMISFAVKSKEGGGLRAKYEPVIDPATGQQEIKDNLPVYKELPTTGYEQDISKIFATVFGDKLPPDQLKTLEPKFWSFVGIVELMKQFLDPNEQQSVANGFIDIVFGKGAQRLYKDNLKQDLEEKNAAVNKMYEILGIQPPPELKQMIADYTSGFKGKPTPVTEETAKPNYARQGIQHIYNRLPDGRVSSMEMKDADFIALAKEIADNGGTLDNIPVNLKVDGAGIRFGKDEQGQPFFMTSRVTDPLYANDVGYFTNYGKQKGQTPDQLARTKAYDDALDLIVNSNFIQKLPPDTIVQAEMLYNPMAEKVDGQLKFVNIPYDPKKLGKQMTLVPFIVKQYSTGESSPNQDNIIKTLLSSSDSNIKIITNKLNQKGIDVSKIVEPVLGLDPKNKQANKEILDRARQELSNAIINNPRLKGKDALGDNMEGIVVNMPSGRLFKVTSSTMKSAMANKMAPSQSFGTTDPRTAVVAIGNFAGHKGHEQLINFAIDKANELGGTPFVFVGHKVGPDDPIDINTKLETLKKLFPGVSVSVVQNQIDPASGQETPGNIFKKIEYELIKKEPFYNNVVITVGSDQAGIAKTAEQMQSRYSKFPPLSHVKVSAYVTPRKNEEGGTGVSTTQLRNALKTMPDEQAFQMWSQAYNVQKLGADWIKHLMDIARQNMGIQKQETPVKEKMLPKNAFAGTGAPHHHKLGPAAHLKGKTKRPARAGDLVGDAQESIAEEYERLKSLLIERIIQNEFNRT